MDQETAKKLQKDGSTFILKDFPIGSEFGIDLSSFTIGEKFKGMKMIPPGLHFVHYSSVSKFDRSSGPKSGFFHFFKSKEMFVKSWDVKSEDVSHDVTSDEETERYQANLQGDLDQYLGPFDFRMYQKWRSLTDYINEDVVKKLNPSSGRINSVTQLIPQPFYSSTKGSTSKAAGRPKSPKEISSREDKLESMLPHMDVEPSTMINFTKLDPKKYLKNASRSEISQHSIDRSLQLELLAKEWQNNLDNVLGELQFAFVCFLAGQVYDAFESWKALIRVICNSDSALNKYPDFFMNFIRVLHFQLREVDADLFIDIVENDNFILSVLRSFFYNLEQCDSSCEQMATLKKRGLNFKKNLSEKYEWDFGIEHEGDDEAPVVVDFSDY